MGGNKVVVRFRIGTARRLAAFAMVVFAGQAAGQTLDEQRKGCIKAGPDFDRRIEVCTDVIRSGQLQGEPLAIALANRGVGYAGKGQLDPAIKDFSDALALKPDLAVVYERRAIAYGKKGDANRALADFAEALKLNPTYAHAMLERAIFYHDQHKDDQAFADLDRAIQTDPKLVS